MTDHSKTLLLELTPDQLEALAYALDDVSEVYASYKGEEEQELIRGYGHTLSTIALPQPEEEDLDEKLPFRLALTGEDHKDLLELLNDVRAILLWDTKHGFEHEFGRSRSSPIQLLKNVIDQLSEISVEVTITTEINWHVDGHDDGAFTGLTQENILHDAKATAVHCDLFRDLYGLTIEARFP